MYIYIHVYIYMYIFEHLHTHMHIFTSCATRVSRIFRIFRIFRPKVVVHLTSPDMWHMCTKKPTDLKTDLIFWKETYKRDPLFGYFTNTLGQQDMRSVINARQMCQKIYRFVLWKKRPIKQTHCLDIYTLGQPDMRSVINARQMCQDMHISMHEKETCNIHPLTWRSHTHSGSQTCT